MSDAGRSGGRGAGDAGASSARDAASPEGGAPRAPVAVLRGVGKRYGQGWAVRDISLTLSPGEIVGFIGPNGAGKTTLMRLIAGLTPVTEGQITVMGEAIGGRSLRTPPRLGVVLEQMGFLPHLSGRANLELLAGLGGVDGGATVPEALARVGLDPADRRPVRSYSLGMRQRLALAQALMDGPALLLLDEPTNGLDPAGIVELRDILRRVSAEGTAVLLASHLLTEVERLCDRVLLVRAGQMLGDIDLRSPGPVRARVVVSTERDAEKVAGSGLAAERIAGEGDLPTFLVAPAGTIPELVEALIALGVSVEEVRRDRRSLESEFLALFR